MCMALYGLKQAPRVSYEKLKKVLVARGFHNTVADSGLLMLKRKQVVVFVLIYMDDILLTGPDTTYIES